ncbi:MAG: Crp/Fnr family transcriptional regulator [Rhodospirillaceae bacterium]|nr:Crp/Fnr family transcriptional regulator [Rhodospirillaceae bacterium]
MLISRPTPCSTCPLRSVAPYGDEATSRASEIEALRKSSLTFPARRLIYREGHESQEIYQLYDGWAFCYKTTSDGRRQILSFLLPGDTIGFPLLFGERMSFSVKALTALTACAFDRQQLMAFLLSRPTLAKRVVALIGNMANCTDEQLMNIGRHSASERIVRLIASIVKRLQVRGLGNGNVYPFPLTQLLLADATGLTPIHVGRMLRDLRDDGLFTFDNKTLTVHDSARLLRE